MFGIFFAIFCTLALIRLWRGPRFGACAANGIYGPRGGHGRGWNARHCHGQHSRESFTSSEPSTSAGSSTATGASARSDTPNTTA